MSSAGTGSGSGLPIALGAVAAYGIIATLVAAAILAVVLIVAMSRSDGPKPVAIPAGATVSRDGFYWWDGASWRPVR